MLEAFSARHLDSELGATSFLQLSAWRRSGAYRVMIETRGGRTGSVIYKDAVFDTRDMPAVANLGARPGISEYLVYRDAREGLRRHLPEVFHCEEIVPFAHYRYLLEDLRPTHRDTFAPADTVDAARALPSLHDALLESMSDAWRANMPHYDAAFSAELQEYARTSLEAFHRTEGDRLVNRVLDLWPAITALHGRAEFHTGELRPIHGDFSRANTMVDTSKPGPHKAIDWDWAGLGKRHTDLATLVGPTGRKIEDAALAAFASQDPALSPEAHRRLYLWCKLERSLLDASFLGNQYVEADFEQRMNIPRRVHVQMRRALDTYHDLAEATR